MANPADKMEEKQLAKHILTAIFQLHTD